MTRIIITFIAFAVVVPPTKAETVSAPRLKKYISVVAKAAQTLSHERRELLDPIAARLAKELKRQKKTSVIFVCTHNSRRSQFSHVWAHTAATHYGLENVRFASGGTETTAANIRTVHALRRAGFSIKPTSKGDNPIYALNGLQDEIGCRLFSKIYSDKSNPKRFLAVLCCSEADKSCPVVVGAVSRLALHYVDPKISDGTVTEDATYDERCRQIATEMFYLVSQVKKRTAAKSRN
jgi:protein-tyrosine-phosphatase